MSIRPIVHIDADKCDGCGQCVTACAEGAIQMVNGKAKLVSDVYCDGLGACLGDCPRGAIRIEHREALDFDEHSVAEHLARLQSAGGSAQPSREAPARASAPSCPGSRLAMFPGPAESARNPLPGPSPTGSLLGHWPIQIKLVPPHAPFLKGADLVVCADCVPFAVPDFHSRYLDGRAIVVGCPKLDDLRLYHERFVEMFATARPRKITVLKMEVPCCGGIAQAAILARDAALPETHIEVHTVGVRGGIRIETHPGEENPEARGAVS